MAKTAAEHYAEAEAQVGKARSLLRPLMIAAIEAAIADERARCAAVARSKAGGEPDGTCCNQMWWDACISVADAIERSDAP